eukprot:c25875_g1_i1.p1 GENE.c25875_g1_i1~~c25875_g1_i1.p1  ORF type:complete len:316 (+),score=77.06 c25875_g1_i1:35-982(+)
MATEADFPLAQSGGVVIVTGASSGIGIESTRIFAQKGWTNVVMAVRNVTKAQECVEQLRPHLTSEQLSHLHIMKVDVASSESIRSFCQEFRTKFDRLDVLVNNAGVMFVSGQTPDGHELHMGTNVFGPFIMTGLLLDLILKTPNSRIVNVSSGVIQLARAGDLADLTTDMGSSLFAYARSKLCNVLFTHELARRLESSGKNKNNTIVVTAHPGYANTNLQFADKGLLMRSTMWVGNTLLAQSAAKGAWPVVLASVDSLANSGDFYGPSGMQQMWGPAAKAQEMTALATDPALGASFFDQCQLITALNYNDVFTKL